MKILLTGFEPFGGEPINPSFEAVKLLPDTVNGEKIVKLELPTSFKRAPEMLIKAIKKHKPEAIICVGQAGGAKGIRLEKVAINLADAGIPDNDGDLRTDSELVPGGENAYFSTLPITELIKSLSKAKIKAAKSLSAGAYVCNAVFYSLMDFVSKNEIGNNVKYAGFIHVPYIPSQTVNKPKKTPAMELEEISKALEIVIKTITE